MHKILCIAFALSLLFACSKAPEGGYILTGKILGKVPSKAYLQQHTNGEMKTIDSANFVKGEFKFVGKVIEPDFYYIRIGDNRNLIGLFLENSEITINSHIDSLNMAKISGSKIQNQYIDFKMSQQPFEDAYQTIYTEFKTTENPTLKSQLEIKLDSIDKAMMEASKAYVLINTNTILAPYIIRHELIYGMDLINLENITNSLNPTLKDNKYTKQLYTHIEKLRTLQPGMPAPIFSQINTNGDAIKLADFAGKYLLIDFWASWCGPCRRANPKVVKVYEKYKRKNFTILGVSMDSDKNNWMEAIETDKLEWTQVSSLEGWNNPMAKLYGVNSIPHAILIAPDGKIIKRNIQAEELDELLAELFIVKPTDKKIPAIKSILKATPKDTSMTNSKKTDSIR